MDHRYDLSNQVGADRPTHQLGLEVRLRNGYFVDELRPYGGDPRHHRWGSVGTDPLSMALGRLRGLVGVQIGALASEFDLDVGEDLALIIPDDHGWFFERFPPGPAELDSEP